MKNYLIIGNKNAVTTKYVFPLIKDRVLNTGYTVPRDYTQPEWCETKSLNGLTRWFTTLPVTDKEPLVLTARYSPEKYPKYDNYDAIEVGALKDIPFDYSGVMGVPITILDKNLDNIVIEGILYGEYTEIDGEYIKGHRPMLNGEQKYSRVLIKRKSPEQFEIVDARTCAYNDKQKNKSTYLIKDADGSINGKPTYARILIRKRTEDY